MSGKIIIENLTEKHLQYRIDHQAVCVKVGRCFCKKGRRSNVATSVHVAGGVGMRTNPVNPAVALVPQVRADASGSRPRIRIIGSIPDAAVLMKANAKRLTNREKAETKAAAKAAAEKAKASSKAGKDSGGGRKGNNN